MQGELHVGDVGVAMQSLIKDQKGNIVNLSIASGIQFVFFKPGNPAYSVSGAFVTDGTDGLVQYITTSTDFTQAGEWKMQVYITFPAGILHTDWTNFKVFPNLL